MTTVVNILLITSIISLRHGIDYSDGQHVQEDTTGAFMLVMVVKEVRTVRKTFSCKDFGSNSLKTQWRKIPGSEELPGNNAYSLRLRIV